MYGIFSLLVGADPIPALEVMLQCMKMLYDKLDDINRPLFRDMYYSLLKVTSHNAHKDFQSIHDMPAKRLPLGALESFALSLEKRVDNVWLPADIFYRSLGVSPKSDLTPAEALASSLNLYGKVNLTHMEEVSKMTAVELCDALKEQIYFNPITGLYEEAECWVCGNVVKKAREAEQHISRWKDGERTAAERAVEALHNARPERIPFADIDCQFGSRWVPIEYYKKFICHCFDVDENRHDDVEILYSPATDDYVGDIWFYGRNEWAVNSKSGADMILYAMKGAVPNFTYTIDGKSYPDEEARALALKVVDKIKEEWNTYINLPHNSELRADIETIYNDRFNCEVKPQIDGSYQTFPDLRLDNLGIKDLYDSQKQCVALFKRQNGGIAWHQVGSGKTLVMCVTTYEMKRLGMVNKPIIIGLKANIGQIAETYRKAYPNAKLLYPSNSDFQQKNRINFLNQIKNNDWDCIIMSHEQFGRLPMALETEARLKQEEIDALDEVLNTCYDKNMSRVLKGLQKRRERMAIELGQINAKISEKKDPIEDFSQLEIDFITVDESQAYKALPFATRNERVAGIGNPKGSQKAWHLLTAIRDIQHRKGRDLCAAFLSGTIVSNSLTELYLIFKYLRPRALAEQNVYSFDAWAAIFCEKKVDYELNIVNQVRPKERFATYLNVPELAKFLAQICDYRTTEMCGLDVPKKKVHFLPAPPTDQQQDMIGKLLSFVNSGSWSDVGIQRKAPENLDTAKMLIATNLCRQTALDPRMLDDCKTYGDEEGCKVRRCAENIYKIYTETQHYLGTQFVFNDISTWDKDKWNMQQAVRDVLVNEYGIPSEEVCFINTVTTESKRLEVFEKMNNGQIRILFGSTTKLGTGVNAQQRCVAIHHLDIPWRPSDLEQRNGRGCRQGNWVAKERGNMVDVFMYATEKTLDPYMYTAVRNKGIFIQQIASASISVRRFDDSMMKDDESMSMSEYISVLSGNTDLLDRSKLNAKIMALESERKNFYSKRNAAVAKIAQMRKENTDDAEWIRLAKIDLEYHKDINNQIVPNIFGYDITDMKSAGKAMYDIDAKNFSKEYKKFGECGSLDLVVRRSNGDMYNPNGSNYFYIVGHSGQYYSCCQGTSKTGKILRTGHEKVALFPYDTFSFISRTINDKVAHIAMNKSLLPEQERLANTEWDSEATLNELKAKLEALDARIRESIKPTDSQAA